MRTYQLIYQSQAMVPFNAPALRALQQQAQAHNGAHGITGVLLHTADGRFLQLLEGAEAAVRHLYHHIVRDPRHRDCHILAEGRCREPSFARWAMVLRFVRPNEVRALLAYVPANNQALRVPRPRTGPELAAALLAFVATAQAAPQAAPQA